MSRKILTLFLAIIMLTSIFPLQVFTETVNTVSDVSDPTDEPVEYVDTINDTPYATLAEAVEAALIGDTIKLLTDFNLTESVKIPVNKTITLDLNGKTVTGTDNTSKNFGLIDNVGTLTVTDGVGNGALTLTATINSGWNRYSAVISNNPGGTLVINSGRIEHLGGTDMAYGIDSLTNNGIGDVSVTVNGGIVKSTYRGIRQFLNCDIKNNSLTINGGTVEGAKNSIFFQDPNAKANKGVLTVGKNADVIGDVYLFVTEGSTEWPVDVYISVAALNGWKVTSKNVPDGYGVVEESGIYSVSRAVATIGEDVYYTLSNAIEAAKDGDTVKITADIYKPELTVNIPEGVKLDLNGHTVTLYGLAAFGTTSSVIDSAEPTQKGLLKVAKNNLTLGSCQYPMFPIWNEQDTGYVFVDFRFHNVGIVTDGYDNGSFMFWFRPSIGSNTVDYFADGILDNGLSISVELELILADGTVSDETVRFAVSDALIADVYSGASGNNVIKLDVGGVTSEFKQVNIKLVFTSDRGMVYTTQTLKYYTVNFAE